MLRPYWSTCWGPIWPLQSERSCAPKEPTWKLLRCAMLKSLRGSDQPCSEGHYPQIGPQKPSRITKTSQSGFMGTGHCSSVWALDKKSWAVIDRPYSLGCATVGALYERPRCIFCAKPILTFGVLSFLVIVMTTASAWAQATAQISGSVRDQSAAVLPGVEITATQTDTGVSRMTITNEAGLYVMPNLALGPYRLQAALQGFRTFVQTGILLQVNSSPVINVVLDVGQVSEAIEVQANAVTVEMRSLAVGQVIDNQRIVELPLNGRDVTDLISLSGAAAQVAVSRTGKGMKLH